MSSSCYEPVKPGFHWIPWIVRIMSGFPLILAIYCLSFIAYCIPYDLLDQNRFDQENRKKTIDPVGRKLDLKDRKNSFESYDPMKTRLYGRI